MNYLIISKTYQRHDVSERDNFQNCNIFVACRAGGRASHVALVVALVCGQSRDVASLGALVCFPLYSWMDVHFTVMVTQHCWIFRTYWII